MKGFEKEGREKHGRRERDKDVERGWEGKVWYKMNGRIRGKQDGIRLGIKDW